MKVLRCFKQCSKHAVRSNIATFLAYHGTCKFCMLRKNSATPNTFSIFQPCPSIPWRTTPTSSAIFLAIPGTKLMLRLALAKDFRMPTSDFAFILVKPQLWKIVDYNTCQKQNCAEFKQCTAMHLHHNERNY